MADNESVWTAFGIVAIIGAGVWLSSNYEIRRIEGQSMSAPNSVTPALVRPTGLLEVGRFEEGEIWRLDADSVSGPRNARQAWIISDLSKVKADRARESKALYRINCDNGRYAVLSILKYNAKGKVITSIEPSNPDKEQHYAPPGTYVAGVIKAACRMEFDPPAMSAPRLPPAKAANS